MCIKKNKFLFRINQKYLNSLIRKIYSSYHTFKKQDLIRKIPYTQHDLLAYIYYINYINILLF